METHACTHTHTHMHKQMYVHLNIHVSVDPNMIREVNRVCDLSKPWVLNNYIKYDGLGPSTRHKNSNKRTKLYLHQYMCVYVCVCVCIYIYIYIYIHTHIHKHIHAPTQPPPKHINLVHLMGIGSYNAEQKENTHSLLSLTVTHQMHTDKWHMMMLLYTDDDHDDRQWAAQCQGIFNRAVIINQLIQ